MIQHNGNIGINIIQPTANLHIYGTNSATNSTTFFIQNALTQSLFRVLNNGNIGIGTLTASARLDILDNILAGSDGLTGSILNLQQTWNTTGSVTAFKINVTNNSSGTNSMLFDYQINNNSLLSLSYPSNVARLSIGSNSGTYLQQSSNGMIIAGSQQIIFRSNSTTISNFIFDNLNINTYSTTFQSFIKVTNTYAPATGTFGYSHFLLDPTYNQTASATGAIVGLYYNPTLTSILGIHNAIETTSGNIIFNQGTTYNEYVQIGNYNTRSFLQFTNGTNSSNSGYIGRISTRFEISGGSVSDFRIQQPINTATATLTFHGNGVNTVQLYTNQRVRFGGNLTTTPLSTVDIIGSSVSSTTLALTVANSSLFAILSVKNNGKVIFGNDNNEPSISPHISNGGDGINPGFSSARGLLFRTEYTGAAPSGVFLFNHPLSSTGAQNDNVHSFIIRGGVQNTFNTFMSYNNLLSSPTINTISGTSTVRGFYYNPVLTSMLGVIVHNAIETTSGNVIINNGNVGIGTGTTIPTARLQISDLSGNSSFIRLQSSSNGFFAVGAGGSSSLVANSLFLQINGGTGKILFINTLNSAVTMDIATYRTGFGFNNTSPTACVDILGGDNISTAINFMNIRGTANPTAGSGMVTGINMTPQWNQTLAASGTIRGIYYNPTTTSILGTHNAIETTSGNIVFNGGNMGLGTVSPLYRLDVISATAISARFNGRVIGATAVNSNEFITLGQMTANIFRLNGYTVATLPSGTIGDIAYVTDALSPTFLSPIVGGGSVVTTCFFNGTNWVAQ